jgi:5-carboxymethyl-2-hydroxymuconate isomerase
MPHLIFEYTDNIAAEADIDGLLQKANAAMLAQDGAFPIGGLRSRAIELKHYRVADGSADDAFVHVTVKIGAGRSEAVKKKAFDELFETIKAHFADLYARRSLALSMEIFEFSEAGTYKHNNIHQRFKAHAGK